MLGKIMSFSRNRIFLALLCCLLFPIFVIACYGVNVGVKGIIFMALPLSSISATGGWILLRIWEKKMQRSVAHLVHSKIEQIHEPHASPNSPKIALYEQEIQRLVLELEQNKAGYEHQINLMQSSVTKSKNEVTRLHLDMDKKLEEMRAAYLEFEDLRKEYNRLQEELAHFSEEGQKKLKHKDSLLNEYQRTISEQRMIIEKKQRYIAKLEGKVRDLMYEIRSLLQLEASPTGTSFPSNDGLDINEQAMIDAFLPSSPHLSKPYDFSTQLQKYIEKAEGLTGVDHLGYVGGQSPRFLDLSLDCYAVDRRRLFDSFKDETGGAVFIISLSEKKFLFVNPSIKSLSGWSQEKFIKEFPQLVVRGLSEWEDSLSKIKTLKECSLRLSVLSKTGKPKQFECYLGKISKGPFAHHALGIFVQT